MKSIKFAKMVASGNDFVVIDTTGGAGSPVPGSRLSAFAKEACDRKYGIGADGLIILEKSKKSDFYMRIFNPDGSEPNMCGNGARCAALFKGKGRLKFETKAGIIEAEVNKAVVRIKMTDPKDLWQNIDLSVGTQFYKVHYINTGVPHTVFFVGSVETINVREVGRHIRSHKNFHPGGTNANFAQVSGANSIKVRTYERGVEDETLACGTGSVASALLSFHLKLTKKSPVLVETKSGETLKVYFDYKNNRFSNVWLEGAARIVFEGGYRPLASK
ncbi:MAG: diaminopimelate epimerase [Candidatus Omnitrophica bacterium]|nr:diaminopimelate epimerase [Candidatus Omnitrophota bacterium]